MLKHNGGSYEYTQIHSQACISLFTLYIRLCHDGCDGEYGMPVLVFLSSSHPSWWIQNTMKIEKYRLVAVFEALSCVLAE